MKNKNFFIGLSGLALMFSSSCVEIGDPSKTETNPEKIVTAENMVTTAEYSVPVVDGFITTVSYNGMLLARTSTPMNIKVPKAAVARGASKLEVTYAEGQAASSYSNLWQTVLFEDTNKGDFDYNDLVLHVNYQTNGAKMTVGIQPIALGSRKDIKLGLRWIQGGVSTEVIVTDNCRTDLFAGEEGFINTTQTYNTHFDDFAKEIAVDLPNSSSSVSIEWFIIVDKNLRINAINQSGEKCLDDNLRPYGFALTNVGSNGEIGYLASRSTADAPEWAAYKPNVSSWAFMPAEPSIPASAENMDDYESWKAKDNTNYVLNAGATFSKQLQFKAGSAYYIQGAITIDSFYGAGSVIYVMPGGELTINSNVTLQGVEIINYGKLNILNGASVGKNAILKSNKNLEASDIKFTVQEGTVYIAGDVVANSLDVINSGKMYANSLTVADKVYVTNNATIYVNGSVNTNLFHFDSNTTCYIDCALRASSKISLTNSADINVKGYINTPILELTSGPRVNVMSGAMIEASYVESTNCKNNSINVIGEAMGAIVCDKINFQDTGDISTFLTGNLGVASKEFQVYGKTVPADGNDITKNASITFEANEISIPKSDCVPGFNEVTNEDNGFAWFSYPCENVSIESCYDFEAWKKGDFNFTLKEGAQVFDITNSEPQKGGKLPVFQMK